MQTIAVISRFFQILFAAVVLGLSVNLAKGQAPDIYRLGGTPSTTLYSAVTGGFGMIAAGVGIVSLFSEFFEGIIMLVLDGLAALLFVAGGIAVAVGLRGVSCNDEYSMVKNDLLNGGCSGKSGKRQVCWYSVSPIDKSGSLKSRCQMDEADSAFMFFGFIVCTGLVVQNLWFRDRITSRSKGIV